MSTRTDYSVDEWATLAKAPLVVSLAVINASRSNPVGVLQELFAMTKTLVDSKKNHSNNQLVSALVEFAISDEGKKLTQASMPKPDQLQNARGLALDTINQVSSVLSAKSSADEASGFKSWLYSVAKSVAAAAKEGGFLGIGGQDVSKEEQAVLQELAGALGVTA